VSQSLKLYFARRLRPLSLESPQRHMCDFLLCCHHLRILNFFFSVLLFKLRALFMLGKCSTTKLHPIPALFCFDFEKRYYSVAQAGLNSQASCLSFLSAGIIVMHHHAW
jgi:hypothetical protein